jgi:DNA-binding winged helix-turn-helix (wHTH) protein
VEHAAHVHAFDQFRFDADRHELSRDGQPVSLEPRAIAVLEDLLLHAGELRSREALLDAVWGHRHVTQDVVHRCIAQLRRALDDPVGQPHFIQTVHRRGYRFVGDVRLEPADEDVAGADGDGAAGGG